MGKTPFVYYDLTRGLKSGDISLIFENWHPRDERVAVLSPHDDDALLGTGYLLAAVMSEGCEPYIIISCDGRAGFSRADQKEKIVAIRRTESTNAYKKFGIKEENILRFNYPDLSLKAHVGYVLPSGTLGTTAKAIKMLREIKPTRLLVPNEYRENQDHDALSYIGTYDGPQIGDALLVDLAEPFVIEQFLKFSVWGDFSPEDALVTGRDPSLRGNIAIKADPKVEEKIIQALKEFKSQEQIIDNLVKGRAERIVSDGYLEVYQRFDPRPTIRYDGYRKRIFEIDKKQK